MTSGAIGLQSARTISRTSLSLWPVLMGPRKSKELFFTGDTISAAEAVDWHLINRVFPKDKLEDMCPSIA